MARHPNMKQWSNGREPKRVRRKQHRLARRAGKKGAGK